MQVRKQYSIAYQVLELLQEVPDDDIEKQYEVSKHFDNFARTELKSMLDVVNELNPTPTPTLGTGTVAVVKSSTNDVPISPAQASTIKKNINKAIAIAQANGILLADVNGVSNLSKKQASVIIKEMYNKDRTGF